MIVEFISKRFVESAWVTSIRTRLLRDFSSSYYQQETHPKGLVW